MADFQDIAREKLKQLSAKKAETRREAAYYLGEAGVDEAITRLAWLYKNDPDKTVRKAAKYALGQFRAVELALKHGEEQRVVDLLSGIVHDGKMGHRAKMPASTLGVVAVVLLLVFVGLMAANFLVPGLRQVPVFGGSRIVAGPSTLAQLRPLYTAVDNDAQTLSTQLRSVLTGGTPDCTVFLNGAQPFILSASDAAAHPELATAVKTLNAAQAAVAAASARYDGACRRDQPLKTEELGGLLGPLVQAQRVLPEVLLAIDIYEGKIKPTNTPAPTDTPAPTATEAATAPVVVANPRAHLSPLYGIIDDVTAPRGANGLLQQYWRDVQRAGKTDGCNQAQPNIPDNYELPPEDVTASPELQQAVTQVNIGLELVRDGWETFYNACDVGTLPQQASVGLQTVTTAQQAFSNAATLLDTVRLES